MDATREVPPVHDHDHDHVCGHVYAHEKPATTCRFSGNHLPVFRQPPAGFPATTCRFSGNHLPVLARLDDHGLALDVPRVVQPAARYSGSGPVLVGTGDGAFLLYARDESERQNQLFALRLACHP